jgi:hypothetical protein
MIWIDTKYVTIVVINTCYSMLLLNGLEGLVQYHRYLLLIVKQHSNKTSITKIICVSSTNIASISIDVPPKKFSSTPWICIKALSLAGNQSIFDGNVKSSSNSIRCWSVWWWERISLALLCAPVISAIGYKRINDRI